MSKNAAASSGSSARRMPHRTFWHPPAVTLIEVALPEEFVLDAEFQLRRLPQRIDLLIIRRAAKVQTGFSFLPALLSQLTDVTLVEFKGGTDMVQSHDPGVLLGYACQYEQLWLAEQARRHKRSRSRQAPAADTPPPPEPSRPELSMGFIAPRLTASFLKGLAEWGGALEPLRPGLFRGMLANKPLFFIETEEIWKHSREDRFFYVLTRAFLQKGLPTEDMTEEEHDVYNRVEAWFMRILQEKTMMFREDKLRQIREENRRFREEFIAELTVEERLRGLSPSEVLKRISLEDGLKGLTPEQREQLKKLL